MKKMYTILVFVFAIVFVSCKKQKSEDQGINCLQDPPAWCANVRCSPDGKPVCGCNNVTYGSACEAQCSGVASFTYGACK